MMINLHKLQEPAPSLTDSPPTIPASPLPLSSPGSTSSTIPPPPSRNELSPTLRFPTLRLELRNLLKDTHFTDCFAMSELGFRKCLQFFVFLPEGYTEILEDLKKDPESHGGPPDCILLCRLREQVLRELGFQNIFKKVEDEENAKAISLFENVLDLNDAIEDEVKWVEHLIRGIFAGNIICIKLAIS